MTLDCEIRVPGVNDGASGHGVPPMTKVGPVSSFLRDSERYYTAVWKHAKECTRCDPAEILRGYLKNRDVRQHGLTSTLLVQMAEKYRRRFGERVPEALVREYVVRSVSSWRSFEDRVASLSAEDIVRAHDLYMAAWKAEIVESAAKPRTRNSRLKRSWPFAHAQGSIGWLNEREFRNLGRPVPERVRQAAALSESDAMSRGGWDLMVWLMVRHDRRTAMEDPEVHYVLALDMAEEILEG